MSRIVIKSGNGKMERIEECRQKIEEADIILIGFGKDFAVRRNDILREDEIFLKLDMENSPLTELEKNWVELTLMSKCLENKSSVVVNETLALYNGVAEYLNKRKKSNYFVVTTCNDDIITMSSFDKERMVAPCGTLKYMKCDTGCFKYVYDTKEVYDNIYSILLKYVGTDFSDRDKMWEELREAMPQCPMCKQVMSINQVRTNNYSEEGYKESWESYMSWLQKTLNRKLVMLEIGEGFDTPTVIRWPFEKVAAVNNKAVLIRVNEKFWQISEDIEAKAISVKENGINFVKELVR